MNNTIFFNKKYRTISIQIVIKSKSLRTISQSWNITLSSKRIILKFNKKNSCRKNQKKLIK